ncbi:MAG: sugar-binding protein [Candidatus Promineifilaceae bacterium]
MEQLDWNNEWRGLEPEQPKAGRCGCWLGVLGLLVLFTATCLGTVYFAWRQLDLPVNPGSILLEPTVPPLASPPPVDQPFVTTRAPGIIATQPPLAPTVTLAGGAPTPDLEAGVSDAVQARMQTAAPQIDGNLSDWGDIEGIESPYRVYNIQGWDGSDDVRAFWQLGWDENNLYVAVQVEDDTLVQTQQGNTIFKGDGVSLQIDTQRAADFGPGLSPDDFQINLSPGDFAGNPPAAYAFRGDNSGSLVDLALIGIEYSALRTQDGYTIEAAIPWAGLNTTPYPGLRLGIALNVNDNDTPGTAEQEMMKSHVPTRQYDDPASWGVLILN